MNHVFEFLCSDVCTECCMVVTRLCGRGGSEGKFWRRFFGKHLTLPLESYLIRPDHAKNNDEPMDGDDPIQSGGNRAGAANVMSALGGGLLTMAVAMIPR